ncbi:hypothetical protein ACEPPN_005876 [Leptodophora sp. 'Broadleaf-Isolate-01']
MAGYSMTNTLNVETEGGTGHVGFICHKQPVMETYLRKVMASSEYCELRTSCVVNELSEDEQWTYCKYTDSAGDQKQIRSRFVVGADGKTGFVRKRYLEPMGVKMERAHNMFYEETWVALNWKLKLPTPTTHPDFPLWAQGYTSEQVYDIFFPKDFRFICNPDRPAVCGRFGPAEERLWRFEYVVLSGEDGHEMASSKNLKKVIYPYLTHPGSRYGLPHDLSYPEDCITVLRSRPFTFSARSCNRWAQGRVILCGDAAHVFPPFGAQGIASGFRDADSLAWRLALLCRSPTPKLESCTQVLTAWYKERQQQLEKSLAATIENGEFVNEANPAKLFIRTWYFYFMSFIPSWRAQMRLGQRRGGMVKYQHQIGMPFMPEFGGGVCVPQVFCKRFDQANSAIMFTDDVVIKCTRGRGLFQLVVYVTSVSELAGAKEAMKDIEEISQGEFKPADTTYLVEEGDNASSDSAKEDLSTVFQIASGDDFAASPLCRGRPPPYFYDPKRLGGETGGNRFLVVRPDRFLFAACSTKEDLEKVVRNAVAYLRR